MLSEKDKAVIKRDKGIQKHTNACSICGSKLSVNNTLGIGYTCYQKVIVPAINQCINENFKEEKNEIGLNFWVDKTQKVKILFLQVLKNSKKNNFMISFYASMEKAERISKKQYEILCKSLKYENYEYQDDIEDIEKESRSLYKYQIKELECKAKNHFSFDKYIEKNMWYNKKREGKI